MQTLQTKQISRNYKITKLIFMQPRHSSLFLMVHARHQSSTFNSWLKCNISS